ncbi:serine/threonine-protein kinase [Geodermatophilus poikilotrophus]|uniref:non-specific serine/threonine protein kinase n=1 Tax=Geodermatophilus poikilotrophus TaxID=1333667 RepID=A0A1I0BNX7_9ACTN|nr:serine/threonine-protein kinase [Geodermatophilus poikilotrophus]SET08728.1 Serine/threonine protein kinase [Geodermatophilus poikilotrophus]
MTAEPASDERLLAGRYALSEVLGRGGMGVVWRATDLKLDRPVAVKEVTFALHLSDEERRLLRERTMREARTAARLDHPSVTSVYDVVEEDGRPWLVMEHVESCSLQQVLDGQGPLPWPAVARIGLDVLAGLTAAHEAGIVHRDVKPGNVLVAPDGRACLTDFGIATATGDPAITTTGAIIGSPSYMAPERAHGEQPGPAVDLWSLGATLYTAVEGRQAFARGEPMATLMAVVTEEPPPPVHAGPLEPVLRGLLTKDPAQRMTAEQARRELHAALDSTRGTTPWSPEPSPPQAERPAPEHERVERIDAADLRALAAASATVIGAVARDARDQARHLAERRRERREVRRRETVPPEAPPAPPAGRRPAERPGNRPQRRRFRRRWVVVPVLVVVLALLAVAAGLVVLAGALLGW